MIIKGPLLYDPRTNKFNGRSSNPALILFDMTERTKATVNNNFESAICKIADFCDKENLEVNMAIGGNNNMTDLVNQGKGNMLKIWGTNNEIILREIYNVCKENNEDFYNPSEKFRNEIIKERRNIK